MSLSIAATAPCTSQRHMARGTSPPSVSAPQDGRARGRGVRHGVGGSSGVEATVWFDGRQDGIGWDRMDREVHWSEA